VGDVVEGNCTKHEVDRASFQSGDWSINSAFLAFHPGGRIPEDIERLIAAQASISGEGW
jgi:hypothetical protein